MVPKVSVLMPVYNGEQFVAEAINSVLSQSFTNFELIIVNDGSEDESLKIIKSFNDPRIVYVHNSENTGLSNVRNKALDIARSEYIAWLDCDDISLPKRFEKQVKLLDENPRIGLCGTWVKTIGSCSNNVWHYPIKPEMLRSRMLFDDPLATSSIMMRAACLKGLETRFDLSYPTAEDYELWERISRHWEIANIPEVLTLYRIHPAQTSALKSEKQQAAIWAIQSRMLDQLGIVPTEDDRRLHLDIGVGWSFLPDTERVKNSERWLLQLEKANRVKRIFPEDAFRRVLAERWLQGVSAVASYGLNALVVYHRSELSRWAEKRLWRLSRLFVRCIQYGR